MTYVGPKSSGKAATVILPDAHGAYHLPSAAIASVSKVDAADVDIVLTTRNGEHFILPGAALEAMTKPDAPVTFADTSTTVDALLGQIGSIAGLGVNIPVPSSITPEDNKAQGQEQPQPQSVPTDAVAALSVDLMASVEKLMSNVNKVDEQIHSHIYDYVPLPPPKPPDSAAPMPPGQPPPLSQTPLVTMDEGNIATPTTYQPGAAGNPNPGYLTIFAGTGSAASAATNNVPTTSPLQFSTVVYEDTSSQNTAYYAQGAANLIVAQNGGADTASIYANAPISESVGAKQFVVNLYGAVYTVSDVTISSVPATDTIVGATRGALATDGTYTWTLPSTYVTNSVAFTLLYDVNQTSSTTDPSTWPSITVEISGRGMHNATYHSKSSFSFQYIAETSASQNATLPAAVYGLQTLDQPNQITLGDGNDIVYGGRNNDTIVSGNGNSQIYESNGNDFITVGNGNNTIVAGNGNDTISFGGGSNTVSTGSGSVTITGGDGGNNAITVSSLATQSQTGTVNITTGQGNDTITVYGGHGTIAAHAGTGNTEITVNTESGATNAFTIATTGSGTTNITGGDGQYTVNTGAGASTVSLGAGNDSITTGAGDAEVNVGYGHDTIVTGTGNSNITVSGGGGTITTTSAGTKVSNIAVNNVHGLDTYTFNLNGTGGAVINGGDDTYIVNGGTGTGNDTINLGAGNDSIVTGSGDARVNVGHGHDTITTGAGNSYVTVNGGGGTITTGSIAGKVSDIQVRNTSASDIYQINLNGAGGAIVNAVDGNYTVNGSAGTGNDTITLGAGNSSITTGTGDAQVSVGHGHDTITTGSGNSYVTVNGGGGTITTYSAGTKVSDLTVQNTSASDVYNINLDGTGNAIVNAVDGNYTINGSSGTGNDTITLGAGNSSITTGSGDARVVVGHGADTITTGSGNSYVTVNGGGGTITTHSAGSKVSDITVQNTSASDVYNINLNGTGNAVVNAVDGNYTVNGATGTGDDTITLGAGNSSITTGSGNARVSVGHGRDTITTGTGNSFVTVNGGGGVITTGSTGANVSNIQVLNTSLSDLYSITLNGSGNAIVNAVDGNYTISGGAGTGNDTITLGNGNDVINTGAANATITVGNGNTSITTGSGTNHISTGTGTHNFILSASNSTVNAAATGATITGGSHDTITSASATNNYALTGNNDVINVNGAVGAFTSNGNNNTINVSTTTATGSSFYGGTGNSTFVGAGTVTGIGADTFYGNGGNSANNGNNIFTNPHAGDFYYATGGAGTGVIAASSANTSITLNGHNYAINFPWQINAVDYSAIPAGTGFTVNLATGTGLGSLAQGSTYGFTSIAGYNSINEIIGNGSTGNTGANVTSSYSSSIFINDRTVNDQNTLSTQHNIIVNYGNNYSLVNAGAASEQFIFGETSASVLFAHYDYSQKAVVINFNSASQTENFTSGGSIGALSGSGYGADTTSYAQGDTFTPLAGTSDNLVYSLNVYAPASTVAGFGTNIIYAPWGNWFTYSSASPTINTADYVFGTGTSSTLNCYWSNGNDEIAGFAASTNNQYDAAANQIVALSYAFAYANGFMTVNNASELQGTGSTATLHGYGPTGADMVFSGYAYATDTTQSAGTQTLLNNVAYVQGVNNDTIIGDNNYSQLRGGSNCLIYSGDGGDYVTATTGNNTIIGGNGNAQLEIADSGSQVAGNNSVTFGAGNIQITVGQSTVTSSGNTTVATGAGSETVKIYTNGNNSVTLGAGNSSVTVQGSGTNSVTLGAGTSVITGGSGINQYHIDTSGTEALTFTAHTVGGSSWTDSVSGTGVNITAISTGSSNNGLDAFWGNAGSDTFNAGIAADSFTGGTGAANVFNASSIVGAGVSSFTGGTGTNTFNGSTVTGSSGIIAYGAVAGGTSGNDTFNAGVGASTYYGGTGNNVFNASTLAGAAASSFYANVVGNTGNGNDTFNGAGTVAGVGADTFYATGNGNHYFENPHAGDAYYSTGGAGVGSIAASAANTSITVGGNTYAINFPWQINAVDYSTQTAAIAINLSTAAGYASNYSQWVAGGTGYGGPGQGSTFGYTSVAGYNSVNEIVGASAYDNYAWSSYSNSIFVNVGRVYDQNTLPTQHNIIIGAGYVYAGAAQENFIQNGTGVNLFYNSPTAIVLNLSSSAQTENFTSSGSIAALSGSGYGSDTTSYAQGDTFTPLSSTSDNIGSYPSLYTPSSTVAGFGKNIVYAPNGDSLQYNPMNPTTNTIDYLFGTAISNSLIYYWSNGNDEFAGSAASTNNRYYATANQIVALSYALAFANGFTTVNNTSELQGSGSTATLHGYGPTGADMVFAGYAYANDTTQSANTMTLLNNVESVNGAANDTIIGDNNNNQIDLTGSGSNEVIYEGIGNDTIYCQGTGFNQLHLGSSGTTTLVFNLASSPQTEVVLGNGTFFGGTSDLDTIFGSATTPSYNTTWGSNTYEIYSNGSHISITGSSYSSGVAASGNTDFGNYDNLYYADTNTSAITAKGGNSIVVGSNDGAVHTGTNSMNTIFYENATVGGSITDTLVGGSGGTNTVRIPGLVLQAESGTTDPFSSTVGATETADATKFRYINALDIRTGTDSLSSGTYNGHQYIIDTFGTSNTAANAISMSALDIINLNHTASGSPNAGSAASSSTPFTLYLDKGDTFTPDYTHGSTTMAGGSYNGTAVSDYNTNAATHTVAYEYMNGGTNVAYLNVHFGA